MWICWTVTYLLCFYGEFCSSAAEITPRWTPLPGLKGGSVEFPVPISKFESGAVRIEGIGVIAVFIKGHVSVTVPTLANHVVLSNQTGYLLFHNLRTGDSGEYVIEGTENSKPNNSYFQLTVYEEVPKPQVMLYDNSSCTWMCSVENGRDVTLAWYEGNVLLNQTSNPDSNISLSLHLKTVNPSTYVCVAANPAINRTSQLLHSDIPQHCLLKTTQSSPPDKRPITIICVAVLSVVCIIVIGGVVLFLRKRRTQYTEAQSTNEELRNEVQYSEILHSSSRLRQASEQHISELGVEGEESSLTSVYAKVQPHPSKATGKDNTGTGSGSTVLDHL